MVLAVCSFALVALAALVVLASLAVHLLAPHPHYLAVLDEPRQRAVVLVVAVPARPSQA